MKWIMAHVQEVGLVVFYANPEEIGSGFFEFQKPSVILTNPQNGAVGLAKLIGHDLKVIGGVGRMNSSALAFWHYVEDAKFAKTCEESWEKEPVRGGGIVMPTADATRTLANGKGLRLT